MATTEKNRLDPTQIYDNVLSDMAPVEALQNREAMEQASRLANRVKGEIIGPADDMPGGSERDDYQYGAAASLDAWSIAPCAGTRR